MEILTTNNVTVLDPNSMSYSVVHTDGCFVRPRKHHCACVMGNMMISIGGQLENGNYIEDAIGLDLFTYSWTNLPIKNSFGAFSHGACCYVAAPFCTFNRHKLSASAQADQLLSGVYVFGGKGKKGYLPNQLYYLLPGPGLDSKLMLDNKPIRQAGLPPSRRVGHTMTYLPINKSILIAGGRNDEECGSMDTPYLNDIFLFLLDQKVWIQVKYTPWSERLSRVANHSSCLITDWRNYEKTIIFGGIEYN